jgi:RNA polymerase sigma-70 factor, ECF subfamily
MATHWWEKDLDLLHRLIDQVRLHPKVRVRLDRDDLYQNVVLRLIRAEGFGGGTPEQELAYLRAVVASAFLDAHEKHLDAGKRDARKETREADVKAARAACDDSLPGWSAVLTADLTSPSGRAAAAEEYDLMAARIAALPDPREREAMRLRHVERLPLPEIARRMGLTVGAVAGLIARAARRLGANGDTAGEGGG